MLNGKTIHMYFKNINLISGIKKTSGIFSKPTSGVKLLRNCPSDSVFQSSWQYSRPYARLDNLKASCSPWGLILHPMFS